MQKIRDLLLDRLQNEWLEKWKEDAPSRLVDKWRDKVPEHWCNGLEEKVPEYWLEQLQETRDAIQELDSPKGKERYQELRRFLKKKYEWVGSMNAGKIWTPYANEGQEPQVTITWRDFLSQVIDILLTKTHRQWDDSHIEFLYPFIKQKIDALVDSLIPTVYKAELHGRRQPQNWEDFLDQAIELLLAGKRQWNKTRYPDITEQIKAVVDGLVSAANEQHKKVKDFYSNWIYKWGHLSSQPRKEDEEDSVQYTPSELEEIFNKNVDDEPTENTGGIEPNLDFLSGFNFGDDPELRSFAEQLVEFIEVRHPYKHRINVVLKPNHEIATGLELSEKKVRELIKELKKKLQPHKDNLLF